MSEIYSLPDFLAFVTYRLVTVSDRFCACGLVNSHHASVSHYQIAIHGRRKDFFQVGASRDFSKFFFQGIKSGVTCFLPLEIEKTTFFC